MCDRMIKCNKEYSSNIQRRFKKWTNELLSKFGPDITYSNNKYQLRRPLSRIFLLNESDYDSLHMKLSTKSDFLVDGFEPSFDKYTQLKDASVVNLEEFYQNENIITLDTSLACFCPVFADSDAIPMMSSDFDSVILVCPDRISESAQRLENKLPEIESDLIERLLFRVALTHEIGHHYTLGNFSVTALREVQKFKDLNILEGMANWFAYMFLDQNERWVQAEFAISQRPSYRHYLYFKHSDMSQLLDVFLKDMDYSKAPIALKNIIGGKLNLNGHMVSVASKFNGVAMDWSDKGGTIIAGEEIKALTTMKKGFFITPKIDLLIGRFPQEVTIVTNEIANAPDYGKIPDNIKVLPRDKADIMTVIKNHFSDDNNKKVESILTELGLY